VSLEGFDVVVGNLELEIELEKLEVGLSDRSHEREHDAAARFLGGEDLCEGRLIGAPNAPPEVDLPEGVQGQERRGGCAAVRGARTAQEGVAAAADGAFVADLRVERGGDLDLDGAGLLDTGDGDAQVVAVRQGLANQCLEGLIVEDLPPGQVGQRGRRGLLRSRCGTLPESPPRAGRNRGPPCTR
jgi:hypothetical protein